MKPYLPSDSPDSISGYFRALYFLNLAQGGVGVQLQPHLLARRKKGVHKLIWGVLQPKGRWCVVLLKIDPVKTRLNCAVLTLFV